MAEASKAWRHHYERRTQRGFLMRVYRNMLSRVVGINKHGFHLYEGLPIMPKNVFYMWAVGDAAFQSLWTQWQDSNFERRLVPSIDRLECLQGYTLGNVQWLTSSENNRKIAPARRKIPRMYGRDNPRPNRKLTEAQVVEIRACKAESGNSLAKRFCISPQTISGIRHNRSWRYV